MKNLFLVIFWLSIQPSIQTFKQLSLCIELAFSILLYERNKLIKI